MDKRRTTILLKAPREGDRYRYNVTAQLSADEYRMLYEMSVANNLSGAGMIRLAITCYYEGKKKD